MAFPKSWNNFSQGVYTEQEVEVVGVGWQSDANELEKVKDTGREPIKRRNLPLTTIQKTQSDKDVAVKLPQTAILR